MLCAANNQTRHEWMMPSAQIQSQQYLRHATLSPACGGVATGVSALNHVVLVSGHSQWSVGAVPMLWLKISTALA